MPHQCTNCGRTFADGSKEMLSGCPDCAGTKFQFRPDGFDGDSGDAGQDADAAAPSTPGDDAEGADGNAGDGSVPTTSTPSTASTAGTSPDARDRPGDRVTRTVGSAAATVRDLVSGSAGPDATAATPRNGDAAATSPGDGSAGDAAAADDATAGGSDAQSETAGDSDIIVAECEPVADGEDAAQSDARSQLARPDDVPETDGFDPAAGTAGDEGDTGSTGDGDAGDAPDDSERGTIDDGTTPVEDGEAPADLGVDRIDVDGDPVDRGPESGHATDRNESAGGEAPDTAPADGSDRTAVAEPDAERADRPDLAELRDELNEQFESIRVVEPGQYELNLMELYDREEYIIALQEDGRYSIQVPETWRDADA